MLARGVDGVLSDGDQVVCGPSASSDAKDEQLRSSCDDFKFYDPLALHIFDCTSSWGKLVGLGEGWRAEVVGY